MATVEERLQKIEDRNTRVESDKLWEQSWTRRIALAVITYLFTCVFLWQIGTPQIFLNALFTTLGFILSTLSLRFIQKLIGY